MCLELCRIRVKLYGVWSLSLTCLLCKHRAMHSSCRCRSSITGPPVSGPVARVPTKIPSVAMQPGTRAENRHLWVGHPTLYRGICEAPLWSFMCGPAYDETLTSMAHGETLTLHRPTAAH